MNLSPNVPSLSLLLLYFDLVFQFCHSSSAYPTLYAECLNLACFSTLLVPDVFNLFDKNLTKKTYCLKHKTQHEDFLAGGTQEKQT